MRYIDAEEVYPSEMEWMPEDELPEIPDRIFFLMFKYSRVDFIRLYPVIYIEGEVYFII